MLHGFVNEKCWDLMHQEIFPFTMDTDAYITKRKMFIMFIMTLRRSLFLQGDGQ